MNPNVLSLLRLLHFVGMGLWFFAPIGVASDVRKTIARGKPHTDLLVERVGKSVTLAVVGGVLTVLSGLGMLFGMGGFAAVGPRIHAGLSLALLGLAIDVAVLRPAIAALGEAIASGDGRTLEGRKKRIAALTGGGHLVKTIILVLMVFRIGGR